MAYIAPPLKAFNNKSKIHQVGDNPYATLTLNEKYKGTQIELNLTTVTGFNDGKKSWLLATTDKTILSKLFDLKAGSYVNGKWEDSEADTKELQNKWLAKRLIAIDCTDIPALKIVADALAEKKVICKGNIKPAVTLPTEHLDQLKTDFPTSIDALLQGGLVPGTDTYKVCAGLKRDFGLMLHPFKSNDSLPTADILDEITEEKIDQVVDVIPFVGELPHYDSILFSSPDAPSSGGGYGGNATTVNGFPKLADRVNEFVELIKSAGLPCEDGVGGLIKALHLPLSANRVYKLGLEILHGIVIEDVEIRQLEAGSTGNYYPPNNNGQSSSDKVERIMNYLTAEGDPMVSSSNGSLITDDSVEETKQQSSVMLLENPDLEVISTELQAFIKADRGKWTEWKKAHSDTFPLDAVMLLNLYKSRTYKEQRSDLIVWIMENIDPDRPHLHLQTSEGIDKVYAAVKDNDLKLSVDSKANIKDIILN